MGGKAGRSKELANWDLLEQLPASPLDWGNGGSGYRTIGVSLVRRINWSLQSLATDRIHESHGCDTAFFGELLALVTLAEHQRDIRPAKVQLEEWRRTYDDWFRRRGFRSEKARAQQATVHMLIDHIMPKARSVPRDFWITEAWPGGVRPAKSED